MLRFCADENLNNNILRGLLRRQPDLDIVRIQDVGLSGVRDEAILEWAASENRIILTHDARTMARFAFERVDRGLPMPGVIEVSWSSSIRMIIDDVLLLNECSSENEWQGQVIYVPFKD